MINALHHGSLSVPYLLPSPGQCGSNALETLLPLPCHRGRNLFETWPPSPRLRGEGLGVRGDRVGIASQCFDAERGGRS